MAVHWKLKCLFSNLCPRALCISIIARFVKSSLEVQTCKGVAKLEPLTPHFLSQYITSLSAVALKPDKIGFQQYHCRCLFFIFLDNFLSRGLESGLQGEDSSFDDIPPV